ncbi:Uncharacterized protein conserved in bacteria [Serratia quinivorans]|uniref:acyltransferase family protein n=1 Tax=Serratia quinivorans TaxID=137545 RepID=UPI000F6F0030|nr:acyltransferase [Serratia quinivorans]VEI68799.1 Uncharacterized protein conserved in bacteria [Serratia quinivorans]
MEFTSLTTAITISILLAAILTSAALSETKLIPTINYPIGEYKSISGIRGLAALFVYVNHAPVMLVNMGIKADNVSQWGWIYANLGSFGVQIFFCITGFLFFDRIIKVDGKLDWNKFFQSRVKRIAPLFYFSSLLCVLISIFYSFTITFSKSDLLTLAGLATFSFIDSSMTIGGMKLYPLNSVIWTLVHEWRFYMALPLICFAFCNAKIGKFAFIAACIIAVIDFKNSVVVCWPYFLTGILVAYIANLKLKINKPINAVVLLLAAALFIVTAGVKIENGYNWQRFAMSSIFFLCIVIGDPKILHSKSLRYLGEISYSIYLMHLPILFLSIWVLSKVIDIAEITQYEYWLFITMIVPVIVMLSSFSFKYIELKFMGKK